MNQIEQEVLPIEKVVERLFALQRKVFGDSWPRNPESLVWTYHLLMSIELAELVQETNFKQHKKVHPLDIERMRDESIDVLIYAIEMCGAVFEADWEQILAHLNKKSSYNGVRKDWLINMHQSQEEVTR